MEFLIITGLSGAGKSRAADVLEDLEYYCVDNMPVALMPRFAELCVATGGRYEKVALVTDVREKDVFGQLLATLDQLLSQAPLLKDFKAVQTGHVWCTGQNVFQQSMSIGGLLLDFHQVITREDPENLTYLYPLT